MIRSPRTSILVFLTVLVTMIVSALPTASAVGIRGRGSRSDAVPPGVWINAPVPGATVSGTIIVAGTASDDFGLLKVKYRVDNKGNFQLADGTTIWSGSVNTTTYSDGAHVLSVRAVDNSGNGTTATVSFVIANGSVPPAPSPSPSPNPTPTLPNSGTIVGMASNESGVAVVGIEQALGVRFLGVRTNLSVAYPLPASGDMVDQAAGLWVYRNANNENVNQPLNGGWAGIAAGQADAYLATAVPLIAANFTADHPLLFSFHHEQQAANTNQCGIGCNGTAADYRAAFIHIVNFFRSAGVADRMRFVLTATVVQYTNDNPITGISAVDPGPSYVDIYGVDSYTRARSDGTLTKPHPLLNVVSAYAASKGKPYMVGEWGVAANDAGAQYWREAVAQIESEGRSGPGSCFALLTDAASFGNQANIDAVRETMVGNPQFVWAG